MDNSPSQLNGSGHTEPLSDAELAARLEPPPAVAQKIGRFAIGGLTIRTDWRAVIPLMQQCVIIGTVQHIEEDAIEYLAYCEQFDEIEAGEPVPFYDVHYLRTDREEDVFTFLRRL